ncbi:MAG TPA: TorF family putative porin, partial [Gammaproteobacteria bacterium]
MMRLFFLNAGRRHLKTGLLCAALFSPGVAAQIELHAVAASDYVVQGVSQTRGDPSLQGGINYGHRSGWFAGMWIAENKLFTSHDTLREVDYYLGWQVPT